MRRRPIVPALVVTLVSLLLGGGVALGSPDGGSTAVAARPGIVVRDGGFYDREGRLVEFRGVNIANNSKQPPFLPFDPSEAKWWDNLSDWGFNLVRLLVTWEAIEPEKGVYDQGYLDKVQALVEGAASRGIYVFIDMHQDMFSRWLQGDGAPRWAVQEAGVDPDNNNGFGGQFWGLSYILSTDLRKCFTEFWASRGKPDGLQEHYRNAFARLAGRLADNPYVLGYDIHNEPSMGSLDNSNGDVESRYLQPFYEDTIRAIRGADPGAIGFVEPSVLDMYWSKLIPFARDVGPIVFAPHVYDNITEMLGYLIFDDYYLLKALHARQVDKAEELGVPLLVGEFGAPSGIQPAGSRDRVVDNMYRVFEADFTSSTIWNYSPHGADGFSIIDGNGEPRGIGRVVRPYARKLKGRLVTQAFDSTSRRYVLEFKGGSPTVPAVIHVPVSVHYQEGFTVSVSDGSYEFDSASGELSYRCRNRTKSHRLVIRPAP